MSATYPAINPSAAAGAGAPPPSPPPPPPHNKPGATGTYRRASRRRGDSRRCEFCLMQRNKCDGQSPCNHCLASTRDDQRCVYPADNPTNREFATRYPGGEARWRADNRRGHGHPPGFTQDPGPGVAPPVTSNPPPPSPPPPPSAPAPAPAPAPSTPEGLTSSSGPVASTDSSHGSESNVRTSPAQGQFNNHQQQSPDHDSPGRPFRNLMAGVYPNVPSGPPPDFNPRRPRNASDPSDQRQGQGRGRGQGIPPRPG